jgi:hypothetical protein
MNETQPYVRWKVSGVGDSWTTLRWHEHHGTTLVGEYPTHDHAWEALHDDRGAFLKANPRAFETQEPQTLPAGVWHADEGMSWLGIVLWLVLLAVCMVAALLIVLTWGSCK